MLEYRNFAVLDACGPSLGCLWKREIAVVRLLGAAEFGACAHGFKDFENSAYDTGR